MRTFRLDKTSQRMKISMYLRQCQNYSHRQLRNVKVFLDGKQVRLTKKLPSSGILKVIEKEKITNIEPIHMNLDIAYEDDDILIVNKPYNLVVHPTKKNTDITLANGIVDYLNLVPRFYNRLDMDTTGLIVIAKNSYTQAFLQNNGEVRKKYIAIVHGKITGTIEIEKNIYRVENELKRIIDPRGQYAKTIVSEISYSEKYNRTIVQCELLTGRTHQIRVHLSSIGNPIVGDKLYSDINDNCRQMLHSYYIKFIHPRTKQKVSVQIPMYKDMSNYGINIMEV